MVKFAKVGTGRKITLILSGVNMAAGAAYGLTLLALQYTSPFLWSLWGISEFASFVNLVQYALKEPNPQ